METVVEVLSWLDEHPVSDVLMSVAFLYAFVLIWFYVAKWRSR